MDVMACGCAGQSLLSGPGIVGSVRGCGVHWVTAPMAPKPSLEGRIATCAYGEHGAKPSSPDLAFFEYRGPGSRSAEDTCECGYYRGAHAFEASRVSPEPIKCSVGGFKARGDRGDLHYCGCRGWD